MNEKSLYRNFFMMIIMIVPIFLHCTTREFYSKEELEYLLSLSSPARESLAPQLDLIATNAITNDSVFILKEPIYLNRKEDAPLAGMKFVIKGTIPVGGLRYYNGIKYPGPAYKHEKNLDVVEDLLEAGAIIIGQGKGAPLSARSITNPFGELPLSNRINPKYSSGGSSGGAASHNFFGLGTDIAGSGRVPAAYNKRFTLYGVHKSKQRNVYGLYYTPITDSTDDLWKIYSVLAKQNVYPQLTLGESKKKKIAFVEKLPSISDDFEVHISRITSLDTAAETLHLKGHDVRKIDPQKLKVDPSNKNEARSYMRNFIQFFAIEIAKGLNKHADKYGFPKKSDMDIHSWMMYNLGTMILKNEMTVRQKMINEFEIVRQHTIKFKEEGEFDLIITPTILGEWEKPEGFSIPLETQTRIYDAIFDKNSESLTEIATELYLREFNLCNTFWGNIHDGDLPIVVVPGARDEWGMYHSYQLIGLNGKNPREIYELMSLAKELYESLKGE